MRIYLLDSGVVLCAALRKLLLSSPGLTVVGTSHVPEQAETEIASRETDVLILDRLTLGSEWLAQLRRLAACQQSLRLVLVLIQEESGLARAAFEAGAHACVRKSAAVEELPLAIESVLAGRAYLSPMLAAWADRAPRAAGASGAG